MRRAALYVMLERSEASLPGWALGLFASLKSRTMSVLPATLEDEHYQAAVTPSEAEGLRRSASIVVRLAGPAELLSYGRIRAFGNRPSPLRCDGALDFSTRSKRHFRARDDQRAPPWNRV